MANEQLFKDFEQNKNAQLSELFNFPKAERKRKANKQLKDLETFGFTKRDYRDF